MADAEAARTSPDATPAVVRRDVVVRGRVQGVGFRWSAAAEAERLGVSGVVENRADGTVHAQLEGPAPAVDELLRWLRHGPEFARVDSVESTAAPPTGQRGFTAR